jgi:hypothetical protein
MNINRTFTSTRTAITVNTTNVWTSKAMVQRCKARGMRLLPCLCAPCRDDGRRSLLLCSGLDRDCLNLTVQTASTIWLQIEKKKTGGKTVLPGYAYCLHPTRAIAAHKRLANRCIIFLTIIILITVRQHRLFSSGQHSQVFAVSPPEPTRSGFKTADTQQHTK